MPYPTWLLILSWAYLAFCSGCALFVITDLVRGNHQKMWVMNLVWPITAMYTGPLGVWLYIRTRALSTAASPQPKEQTSERMKRVEPTREQVAVATFHCGAGCALGDVISETGLFVIGGSVAGFLGSEFGTRLFADFCLAYVLGIFFQYFTIAPMRGMSPGKGLLAAMRADTISITAFQLGMFGWMALTHYVLFAAPHRIYPDMAVFWFMMQIAMLIGWATSYPANVWLLRKGWKEKMPMYPGREVMEEHRLPGRAA